MKLARDILFLIFGLIVIIWSFYAFLNRPAPAKYQPNVESRDEQTLAVGDKTFIIEVADTEGEREQGLSYRESLPAQHGMLFIFEKPGLYGFWMKDMSFPIDMVWLDESYHIVDIAHSVSPNSFPHVFYPPTPVKYVLETNPGEL